MSVWHERGSRVGWRVSEMGWRDAMLPERLSLAFALIVSMALLYLGSIHRWGMETIFVSVLFAIFCSLVIGRILGTISARELARNIEHTQRGLKKEAENAKP